MLDTLNAINAASHDKKTDDATIEELVPDLWPKLQKKLMQFQQKQNQKIMCARKPKSWKIWFPKYVD